MEEDMVNPTKPGLKEVKQEDTGPFGLYQPLHRSPCQIRLLHVDPKSEDLINCSLSIVELGNDNSEAAKPTYRTLSYAWGSADDPKPIWVNGHQVHISRNLYDFLLLFRSRPSLTDLPIWIDQLCIDQSSNEEKAHQVSIMDRIYRGAKETLAWLGSDQDDGLAFRALRQLYPNFEDSLNGPSSSREPFDRSIYGYHDALRSWPNAEETDSLLPLIQADYWTRHWVCQELALSSHCTFLYGASMFKLKHLCAVSDKFKQICDGGGYEAGRMLDLIESSMHPKPYPLATRWSDAALFAKGSKCVDGRDKVYGIQSLFDARLRIEVDYSIDASDVLRAFLRKWYSMLRNSAHNSKEERQFWDGCQEFVIGMDLEHEIYGDDNGAGYYANRIETYYPRSRHLGIIRLLEGDDDFKVNAEM